MAQIIVIAQNKGGTGKTTTAAALAQAAASLGRAVLAIDMDPQGNLSNFLGLDKEAAGTHYMLTGGDPMEAIQETAQGLDGIAASMELAALRTDTGSGRRLKQALSEIGRMYELIVIDTPPGLGEPLYNSLLAATGVIIPMEADTNSITGLYQLAGITERLKEGNAKLKLSGMIITRFDGRPKLNLHLRDMAASEAARLGIPYLGTVRQGIAIREAQALKQSLYTYAPKSKQALDYMEIYKKIMEV